MLVDSSSCQLMRWVARVRICASGCLWIEWVRVGVCGCKRMQVDASGCEWMRTDANGCEWMRMVRMSASW
jgi:hypothetical protein